MLGHQRLKNVRRTRRECGRRSRVDTDLAEETRRRVSGDLSYQLMQLRERRLRKTSERSEHPQHRGLTDLHQDVHAQCAPHLPRRNRIDIAVTHRCELDVEHIRRRAHAATAKARPI